MIFWKEIRLKYDYKNISVLGGEEDSIVGRGKFIWGFGEGGSVVYLK